MAIVNMFGFDQMPVIPTLSSSRMRLEGLDGLSAAPSGMLTCSTYIRDNRVRIKGEITFHNTGSTSNRAIYLTETLPLSQWFGSPDKLTKGVIGVRVFINDKWKTLDDRCCLLEGAWWNGSSGIISSLAPGEHYFEYVFDFVKKNIQIWVNGENKAHVPYSSLTLNSTFGLGQFAGSIAGITYGHIIDFSDIYVVYDTEDDTPCDRLGPVQVKWLPVEEAVIPSDWDYLRNDRYTHTVDGVAKEYQGLIPRFLESDFKPNCIRLTQNLSAGALYPFTDPSGSTVLVKADAAASDTLILQVEFSSPKQVSGYALMGLSSSSYGFMEDWTFEGSDDGVDWTILDSKTDQAMIHKTQGTVVHTVAPDNRALYTHYRLHSTKQLLGQSDRTYVGLGHFQLLGELEDRRLNTSPEDQVNLPYNVNLQDTDIPVLRSSVSESEASFRFATPEVGSAEIKMVQLRLTGKRDPGTEERLITRSEVGGAASEDQDLRMDTDFRWGPILENLHVDHLNKPWLADTVGQLKLIVKSKTGEA